MAQENRSLGVTTKEEAIQAAIKFAEESGMTVQGPRLWVMRRQQITIVKWAAHTIMGRTWWG